MNTLKLIVENPIITSKLCQDDFNIPTKIMNDRQAVLMSYSWVDYIL
jgi:hypothetical protein